MTFRRELRAQALNGDNLIVTPGNSRFAYLPRLANELTSQSGYVFRSAGSDPHFWYYVLRDLDPAANRYRAVVFGRRRLRRRGHLRRSRRRHSRSAGGGRPSSGGGGSLKLTGSASDWVFGKRIASALRPWRSRRPYRSRRRIPLCRRFRPGNRTADALHSERAVQAGTFVVQPLIVRLAQVAFDTRLMLRNEHVLPQRVKLAIPG